MADNKNNLSARLYGKKDLRMEDVPVPEPGPQEVQLRMLDCGICGSDIHMYRDLCISGFPMPTPTILGHECCGVVVKTGEGVKHLKVGDRVAPEPGVACLSCWRCKAGRYNLCDVLQGIIPKYCPGLSRYAIASADFCYKLPDNISDEEGAFVEPLAVAVYACRRASVRVGDTVLICGAGSIGLLCLLVARAAGVSKVIMTDVCDGKLEKSLKLGANYSLNVTGKTPEETAKSVEEILGCPPDITMECSGAASAVSTAMLATTRGGIALLVGMGFTEMTVPLGLAAVREVDIKGMLRYAPGCFPEAISLLANGQVDVKPLISHRFTLDKAVDAFKITDTGDHLKIMVHCAAD